MEEFRPAAILGSLVFWLFVLIQLADARCPPLAKTEREPSFLEQLAKHTVKDRPLSDQEMLDLMRAGEIKIPPFGAFPPNGPAPLTVRLGWSFLTTGKPFNIELDVDGSGLFRSIDSYFDQHSGMQEGKTEHVYDRDGKFQPTLRVRDEKGAVRTFEGQILVKSQAQFEAELKTTWGDFKTALRQSNLEAALDCTHASAREKYKKLLPELLKAKVPFDQALTDIDFVSQERGRAEFEMLRKEGNDLISYMVEFRIDEDGIWRIRFF